MQTQTEPVIQDIGGKARVLVELELAGFRVPDFLCSPPNVAQAIELLGTPLVVRSSASVEDGPSVSFAGQFRSFLNLNSVEAVESAIEQCKASVTASSVIA